MILAVFMENYIFIINTGIYIRNTDICIRNTDVDANELISFIV